MLDRGGHRSHRKNSAPPTCGLVFVHEPVGQRERGIRRGRRLHEGYRADRGAHIPAMFGHTARDLRTHTPDRTVEIRFLAGQHHGEFVTTETAGHIAGAQTGGQCAGNDAQHRVAS
jgi:hypothetical protein